MNGVVPELTQLYRQAIKRHAGAYPEWVAPAKVTHRADGVNPHCGDSLTVLVHCHDNRMLELGFEGESCLICRASAVLMAEALRGAPTSAAAEWGPALERTLRGEAPWPAFLEPARCLDGVRLYPSRIQCAMLPWHTLTMSFHPEPTIVCTEEEN